MQATQESTNRIANTKKNPEATIQKRDWVQFMNQVNQKSIDLILTDPPYTISRKTGFSEVKKGVKRFAVSMDFGEWDHKQIDLKKFCAESYRVLKHGGTAIIWYDIWKLSEIERAMREAKFSMIRLIIWQKTNPVPLNQSATYLSNSREIAIVATKGGKPTFNSKYDNGIYNYPIPRHGGKRIHPTQKPLELFNELILKHSEQGDLVIDPFLGSGTTGIAAIKNHRCFKGCDINPEYVKQAKKRLSFYK